MPVNTSPQSGRFGQTFRLLPAPGGVYHVYPDGHREFVKAGAAQPAADPGAAALAAQFAHAAQNTGTGPFAGNAAQWQQAAQQTGTGPAAPQSAAAAQGGLAYDAEYWAAKAARDKAQQDALAANDAQGTSNRSSYEEALRRLKAQRPDDEGNTRVGANRQGLLHSSTLGKRLDDLAAGYVRRQGDIQSGFDAQEQARNAARTAIQNGATIDEATAIAQSADRGIARDTTAAETNSLVPNAPPVAPAAPKGYRTVKKAGYVWHYYPDGRKVAVRPA